jgi:precorrin-2 dehydrogenase / sirohydrochlorin ferrochelatase
MDFYPIQLNLKGKQVVIIGGGKIAERKLIGLLDTGAEITIVSPELTEPILEYSLTGKVDWKQKCFTPEDIEDAFLIIAATNDRETNAAVKNSVSRHQLLLMVDRPEASDFILPSVLKQGRLSMTVSTSGASPILTKKIKQDLADQYGPEYKEYVDFLYECRKWILKEIDDSKTKQVLLTKITEPPFLYSENRKVDFIQLVSLTLKKNK